MCVFLGWRAAFYKEVQRLGLFHCEGLPSPQMEKVHFLFNSLNWKWFINTSPLHWQKVSYSPTQMQGVSRLINCQLLPNYSSPLRGSTEFGSTGRCFSAQFAVELSCKHALCQEVARLSIMDSRLRSPLYLRV